MTSCVKSKDAAVKRRMEAEARAEAAERGRVEAEARMRKLEEEVVALRAQRLPAAAEDVEMHMAALHQRAEAAEKQLGRRERALSRAEADIRTLKEEREALVEILKTQKLSTTAMHDEAEPGKQLSSPRGEQIPAPHPPLHPPSPSSLCFLKVFADNYEVGALPGEGVRSCEQAASHR